ncbi:hypothetical protein LMH87_001840 [Akanthomyces muscarius]|uniref:Secreted protein n=1 Tax=Akanthomyces muscarius TaxID=2231603 RepID=A0A9W8UJ29_AKAMU|nr:hypothetical protein LMH87_001840 [Akanthomyces muscarius]KAJ4147308.1 hypothetical protein LMH87_001840 [Akanthomyces muscarius]
MSIRPRSGQSFLLTRPLCLAFGVWAIPHGTAQFLTRCRILVVFGLRNIPVFVHHDDFEITRYLEPRCGAA